MNQPRDTPTPCPACRSDRTVAGQFIGIGGGPVSFLPAESGWWKRLTTNGVVLAGATMSGSAAHVCSACGHAWGRVDPAALQKMIGDAGE